MNGSTAKLSWKFIAAAAIVEFGLVAAAYAHALDWRTPTAFTIGVLIPVFGFERVTDNGGPKP